jgi:hypothetical protein
MRIIILAIALVFAIGVALPAPADARPPREVRKWGCSFLAGGFAHEAFPGLPVVWYGYGRIRGCNPKYKATFTEEIYQAIPGARDRRVARARYTHRMSPRVAVPVGVSGGKCKRKVNRPKHPFYYQLTIKRKGKPGVVRVATRNWRNPCPAGMWPYTS